MGIISDALKILLPPRLISPTDIQTGAFVDGTARAIERLKKFLSDVTVEADPTTTDALISAWFAELDLPYTPTDSLMVNRRRIAAILTAVGGQSVDYLREQLQVEFPDVDFIERTGADAGDDPWKYYSLTGLIETELEMDRLKTLVARLFPAYLEYIDLIDVAETYIWAVCGIGRVGMALTGAGYEE
jgi:hypothetical protein